MDEKQDDGFKPRRIIETTQLNQQHHWRKRKKNNHHQNNNGVNFNSTNVHHSNASNAHQETVTEQFQVPMELRPLITAAMDYGKKTHALGMLKAAQALSNIATRLKTLNSMPSLPDAYRADMKRILDDVETESNKLMSAFGTSYNEE